MNINNVIYEIFITYTCSNGIFPSKKIIGIELRKRLLQKNRIFYFPVKKNYNLNNLDFLFIVKNGQKYFTHFFPLIKNNLVKNISNLQFYIYENNSSDNTKKILQKYNKTKLFNIKMENIEYNENNIFLSVEEYLNLKKYNRYSNILDARNKLLNFYKKNICDNLENLKNNWLILMDIDIIYDYNTIINLFKSVDKYPNGIMFCANTSYVYKTKNIEDKYYDILALEYGKFFNSDKHKLDEMNLFLKNNIELQTGFGGLAIIRKDILLNNYWEYGIPKECKKYKCFNEGYICEHWKFCENIRKYGKIYLVKEAKALWIEDKLYETKDFIKISKLFMDRLGLFC